RPLARRFGVRRSCGLLADGIGGAARDVEKLADARVAREVVEVAGELTLPALVTRRRTRKILAFALEPEILEIDARHGRIAGGQPRKKPRENGRGSRFATEAGGNLVPACRRCVPPARERLHVVRAEAREGVARCRDD